MEFLHPKSHYTKTALFFSCHQLYQETLEYYYGRNTFSLPLRKPFAMSGWRFLPRHFNLVKMLHLEANTFFWISSSNSAKAAEHEKHCKRRLKNYLSAILWANPGVVAPSLKTLIFADSVPPSHDQMHWHQSTERSQELLEGYIQVFEELNVRVGQVLFKIDQDSRSSCSSYAET